MKRRFMAMILIGALLTGMAVCAVGCGSKKETLDLFTKMELAMSDCQSMEAVLDLSISLVKEGDDATVLGTETAVTMEATKDPSAGHMTSVSGNPGEEKGAASEGYTFYKDGVLTSYSVEDGVYYCRKEETDKGGLYEQLESIISLLSEYKEKFKIKETEEIGGKKAVHLEGTISIASIAGLLGLFEMDGLVEFGLKGIKVPVSFWVYEESGLPAKVEVELEEKMQKKLEKLLKLGGKFSSDLAELADMTIDEFDVELTFNAFGTVSSIELPEGVKIVDEEPEEEFSLEEWKDYVLGEAKKYDIDLEKVLGVTEEELNDYDIEDWEGALYKIYQEGGLYGDDSKIDLESILGMSKEELAEYDEEELKSLLNQMYQEGALGPKAND